MHPTPDILLQPLLTISSTRSMRRPDKRLLPKRQQSPNMDMSEPDDAESELVDIVVVQVVDSDIGVVIAYGRISWIVNVNRYLEGLMN